MLKSCHVFWFLTFLSTCQSVQSLNPAIVSLLQHELAIPSNDYKIVNGTIGSGMLKDMYVILKNDRKVWINKTGDFGLACHGFDSKFHWILLPTFEETEEWRQVHKAVMNTTRISCGNTGGKDLFRPLDYCTSHLNLSELVRFFQHAQIGQNKVVLVLCSNAFQSDRIKSQNYGTFFKCGVNSEGWLQVHLNSDDRVAWKNVTCESFTLQNDSEGNCVCNSSSRNFFRPIFAGCNGLNVSQCEDSTSSIYTKRRRSSGILKNSCDKGKFEENVKGNVNNFSMPGMIICENPATFAFAPFLPQQIVDGQNNEGLIEILGNVSTYERYLALTPSSHRRSSVSTLTGGIFLCSGPRFLFSNHGVKWLMVKAGRNIPLTGYYDLSLFNISKGEMKDNIISTLTIEPTELEHGRLNGVKIICKAKASIRINSKWRITTVNKTFFIPPPNKTVTIKPFCKHSSENATDHDIELRCENNHGVSLSWKNEKQQDLCDTTQPLPLVYCRKQRKNSLSLIFTGMECPKETLICVGLIENNAQDIFSNSTFTHEDCAQWKEKGACTDAEFNDSKIEIWVAVSSALGFLLFLLLCLGILFRKFWNRSNEFSDEDVQEFINGVESKMDDENVAFFLPYNTQLEIPLENVEFDSAVLGRGAFGLVQKGFVEGQLVAIKTLKPSADLACFKTHLSELKIMSFIGVHEHIVQLVGASTAQIKKRKVYLIYEFCSNGNLLEYIRERRQIFVDQLEHDRYKPTQNVVVYENASTRKFCSEDLIRWAMEISSGMEYVASLKIYHGDLALRNILLTEDLVAKISDFGLSKQLQAQYAIYVQTKEQALPLKWLALESLRDLEFSIQSDIWSFGICLWELFSLGSVPYPEIVEFSFQAWTYLSEGHRMKRPQTASTDMYDLMIRCWQASPADRPSFTELKEMLSLQMKILGN